MDTEGEMPRVDTDTQRKVNHLTIDVLNVLKTQTKMQRLTE